MSEQEQAIREQMAALAQISDTHLPAILDRLHHAGVRFDFPSTMAIASSIDAAGHAVDRARLALGRLLPAVTSESQGNRT